VLARYIKIIPEPQEVLRCSERLKTTSSTSNSNIGRLPHGIRALQTIVTSFPTGSLRNVAKEVSWPLGHEESGAYCSSPEENDN
jgi:hypothetical protein